MKTTQPLNTTTEWASIASVAEHFDVKPATVRSWINTGVVRAKKFGPKLIRVDVSSLNEMGVTLSSI